ncbi:hypothetical protein LEMLEM_LOCUS16470 [Lemmus lemmus]
MILPGLAAPLHLLHFHPVLCKPVGGCRGLCLGRLGTGLSWKQQF